jgi:hypothetical protein
MVTVCKRNAPQHCLMAKGRGKANRHNRERASAPAPGERDKIDSKQASRFSYQSKAFTSVGLFSIFLIVLSVLYKVYGEVAAGLFASVVGWCFSPLARWIETKAYQKYKAAPAWSPRSWLGTAFLSIILFQSIPLILHLWLLPWRLLYGEGFYRSPLVIVGALLADWIGVIACGVLIGRLMPNHYLTAGVIGASFMATVSTVEAYTGAFNYGDFTLLSSVLPYELDPEDLRPSDKAWSLEQYCDA